MSEKMEVVRIKPCDLNKGQVFRLNYQYKTELEILLCWELNGK